jgi:hypothetical protein
MKYIISIYVNEGPQTGTGLGIEWEADTADPDWRELLPDKKALAAAIEEDAMPDEPTKEMAAEVLRRHGYDKLADVVEADVVVEQDVPNRLKIKPLDARWARTPEGHINNCNLANGADEEDCQICDGRCPDRKKFGYHDDDCTKNGFQAICSCGADDESG